MEKTNVIISEKFLKQMKDLNMVNHIKSPCKKGYKGTIRKISDDLYVLKDKTGEDVCGLLDGATFYSALMETDVAHLFANTAGQVN